jgi:hypothetical protein
LEETHSFPAVHALPEDERMHCLANWVLQQTPEHKGEEEQSIKHWAAAEVTHCLPASHWSAFAAFGMISAKAPKATIAININWIFFILILDNAQLGRPGR